MVKQVSYTFHNQFPNASTVYIIGEFLESHTRVLLDKPLTVLLDCPESGVYDYTYRYMVDGNYTHCDKKLIVNDKKDLYDCEILKR